MGIICLSDSIRRRLLYDISHIPNTTYARAMRIAVKYSMDNVQAAIVRVINSLGAGWSGGIAKLAFLAEFSDHFSKGAISGVFVQVCAPGYYHPSGHDLGPLLAYPNLLALMMRYREEVIRPDQAIWDQKPPVQPLHHVPVVPSITPREKWLNEQLKSLGHL